MEGKILLENKSLSSLGIPFTDTHFRLRNGGPSCREYTVFSKVMISCSKSHK